MPAREVFLAEYLQKAGYQTHAVGKWCPQHHPHTGTQLSCFPVTRHMGKCDNRYEATYRGFDSYQGYLDGAQSYWNHAGDYRNSSTLSDSAGETPACATAAEVNGVYGRLNYRTAARTLFLRPSRPFLPRFFSFFRGFLHLDARIPESGTRRPGGGSVTVENGRGKSGRRRPILGG